MPLPRSIARFNRRVTNRLWLRLAGHVPWFGIVHHVGRRSGREYRTPVNVFTHDGEYVIALTYEGVGDWVKNVIAAGGCELETRGRKVRLVEPRLSADRSYKWAPAIVRFGLKVLGVTKCLRLSPAEAKPGS